MDHYITAKVGQIGHLMRQIGLYNACQLPLDDLKRWMTQHDIDFNLGAAKEKDVLQIAALAHPSCTRYVSFCVNVSEHLGG